MSSRKVRGGPSILPRHSFSSPSFLPLLLLSLFFFIIIIVVIMCFIFIFLHAAEPALGVPLSPLTEIKRLPSVGSSAPSASSSPSTSSLSGEPSYAQARAHTPALSRCTRVSCSFRQSNTLSRAVSRRELLAHSHVKFRVRTRDALECRGSHCPRTPVDLRVTYDMQPLTSLRSYVE